MSYMTDNTDLLGQPCLAPGQHGPPLHHLVCERVDGGLVHQPAEDADALVVAPEAVAACHVAEQQAGSGVEAMLSTAMSLRTATETPVLASLKPHSVPSSCPVLIPRLPKPDQQHTY